MYWKYNPVSQKSVNAVLNIVAALLGGGRGPPACSGLLCWGCSGVFTIHGTVCTLDDFPPVC